MRTAAKLLAAVGLLGIIAVGLLVWRLARGPIPLDALTPRVEATLNAADASVHVAVGGSELVWAGWQRGIYLRARDVRFTATDGAVIANVPALALRVALRALLHRQLAFSTIEVLSPLLHLIREPDGRIDLGLGVDTEVRAENPVPGDVWDALLSSEHAEGPLAYLRRFAVGDGEVVIEDRATGLVVRAPRIDLVLARSKSGITATLRGDLTLGHQMISVESTTHVRAAPRAVDVQLSFRGLNPAGVAADLLSDPAGLLALQHPDLVKQLAGARMDFTGSVDAHLDAGLHPTTAQVTMTGSAGSVTVPALGPQRFDLSGVHLAARFDAAADEVVIEQLAVDLGGPSLSASARLASLTRAATLAADATLTGLPVDALGRYWPESIASGPRAWLTSNLSRGRVPSAKLHLAATLGSPLLATPTPPETGQPSAAPFALTELNGSVAFEGLSVRYLETMPPVTEVSGGGTFTADKWDLRVNAGVVRKLRVGPATVVISKITSKEPTRIAIAATVEGPLADGLEVIDAEPLGFPKEMGIVPSSVAGDMRAQVGFDFPIGAGDIGLDNLGLDVSAQLERVDIPRVIQGWSVAGADLKLTANGDGLDLDGRGRLEGTPVTIEWYESFARRAAVRRWVVAKAEIDSPGRTALGFDLMPSVDGPVGVNLRLTQSSPTTGRIDLRLDLTPSNIEVAELGIRKPPGEPGRANGMLLLANGGIAAVEPYEISMPGCDVQGRAARTRERWSTIDATGTLGEVHADIGRPGGFTLGVRPAGAVESFSLTSDDVSTLLRAIGIYANGRGGRLNMGGTIDLARAPHPFESHVEIANFTVTEAPTLARILTLASLSGIQEAFMREGVRFSQVTAQLSGNTNTIDIGDFVAVGDSIGLACAGRVDHADDLINLTGTVVPAYYGFNATLGKIPLLRDIFSGQHGLGALGIDFSVSGPLRQPQVSVHPLQSLTPGIVHRFTDLFKSAPPEKKRATSRKWW